MMGSIPIGMKHECVVTADGSKFWYLNDKLSRTDGPAVEYAGGLKYWFLDNRYHRTDGPAIERPDGTKKWFLLGEEYKDLKVFEAASTMLVALFPEMGN